MVLPRSAMSVVSSVGLGLTALICTALTFLLGHVLDACNLVSFPDVVDKGGLSVSECNDVLQAGINSASNQGAAQALVFIITLAARIEAAFFAATAVACIYTIIAVPVKSRASIHLFVAVFGALAFLVDGSNAGGMIPFGTSRFVYAEAEVASMALMGVWSVVCACNAVGFLGAGAEKSKKQ